MQSHLRLRSLEVLLLLSLGVPRCACDSDEGCLADGLIGEMIEKAADHRSPGARSVGLLQVKQQSALETKSNAKTPSTRSIGFVKTHKTGSSTLVNIFHRLAVKTNSSVMLPACLDPVHLGWPGSFPGWQHERHPSQTFDMILNHAVFKAALFAAYLKPTPYFVTILRHPTSQIQSALHYFADFDSSDDFIAWMDKGNLTNHPHWYHYVNPMAYDLGYYEAGGTADADSESMQTWIMSVGEVFNYRKDKGLVMPLEWFDKGLILLGQALGLAENDLTYTIMKEGNTLSPTAKAWHAPTAEQSEKILATASRCDLQLYTHFNATFWDAWQAAGSPAKLAQLKNRNTALQYACDALDNVSCPIEILMDSFEFDQLLRQKNGLPVC